MGKIQSGDFVVGKAQDQRLSECGQEPPGDLLEMQNFRTLPGPTESETGGGTQKSMF